MEILDLDPQVLANRSGVAFSLAHRNSKVECVITIRALEMYFWLESQASDARILKAFRDGYSRIRAIAERKLLAHPMATLELTPTDFERR